MSGDRAIGLAAAGAAMAVAMAVAVAVAVGVAVALALAWRRRRRRRRSALEAFFSSNVSVDLTRARAPKSRHYQIAGLRFVYSDGSLISDDALFMSPSVSDLLCTMGRGDTKREACSPRLSHIDRVSCASAVALHPSAACRYSASLDLAPLDDTECTLRVFDARYRLAKSCMEVVVQLAPSVPASAPPPGLLLRPREYTTKALVLLRAPFLSTDGSRMYGLDLAPAPGWANQLGDYDSARPDPVFVPFVQRPPPRVAMHEWNLAWRTVWGGGAAYASAGIEDVMASRRAGATAALAGGNAMQPPSAAISGQDASLQLTVYHVDYLEPHPKPSTVSRAQSVVTMYVPIPVQAGASNEQRVVSNSAFALDLSPQRTSATLSFRNVAGTLPCTIPVFSGGLLVVTYTSNLVVMACLSRTRIVMRHFGGRPPLAITDAEVAAVARAAPAPREVMWYTAACIPNFADVATRIGALAP